MSAWSTGVRPCSAAAQQFEAAKAAAITAYGQNTTLNDAVQAAAVPMCTFGGALTYAKCHCVGSAAGAE